MKKRFTSFAAAFALVVAAILSCNKHDGESVESGDSSQEQSDSVTLSISVSNAYTKSTADWYDDEISSLSAYIFDADGALAASGTVSKATSLDVTCTTGSGKTIYVIANKTLSAINTLSDILTATSSLTDNTSSSFVMSGSLLDTEIQSSSSFNIPISRAAAKVSIDDVINEMSDPAYQDVTFTVTGIYLLNAPIGDYLFCSADSLAYASDISWGNKGKYDSNYSTYLTDTVGKEISYGSSLSKATSDYVHTFYCYPNPTEMDETAGEATEYMTRLVVEVQLGTQTYYYPITLESVERNRWYHFTSFTIRLRGSTDPNQPITDAAVEYSVTIKNWVEVDMGEQEI